MELFKFQSDASSEIAKRFDGYAKNPLMKDMLTPIPFYQNLSSITGSGKTAILCDTVAKLRASTAREPIILWISKGRVVVEQTLTNLTGKYQSLLGRFEVIPLLDLKKELVDDSSRGLILVATVAKFNVKDKQQGDRKIYLSDLDNADDSLWDIIKDRFDEKRTKRPLIVVYDEGHNLSDQQTEILLELKPDALIAASATTRIPPALNQVIDRLRTDRGWKNEDLATVVKSGDVVESGLIKEFIDLKGYITPMEVAVDDLLALFKLAEKKATKLKLPIKPKAIYVSTTNVVETAKYEDTAKTPFNDRQARPIVIWRHLVSRGVDPSEIAVYSQLKFGKENPPPSNFNLFAGGDSDYKNFIEGNYRHIIFNLSLQEGWDDPECYFAYIDKEMGSRLQITQIIGRVLRQPGVKHYPEEILNTAHLFVRADTKTVFGDVVKDIQNELGAELPEVSFKVATVTKAKKDKAYLAPKSVALIPDIVIESSNAYEPANAILNKIQDYSDDKKNTVGQGEKLNVLQKVGKGEDAEEKWMPSEHSNPVTARWILRQEIQKYYPKALGILDIENPQFDARVEYHSLAADKIRESALEIVQAYLAHSNVVQNWTEPIEVPDVAVNEDTAVKFRNALHKSYSDLNKSLEEPFAKALDKTGLTWFRNPSRGLFEIPLLDINKTKNFNPDFIVWNGKKKLVAIDTKGTHLIMGDASRKLFFIDPVKGNSLLVRFVSEGKWTDFKTLIDKVGYTVWTVKNGFIVPLSVNTIQDAVKACLR